MIGKMENRQKRVDKRLHHLKLELKKKNEQPKILTQQLLSLFRKKLIKQDDDFKDDDSELLYRLREWNQHKKDYEMLKFENQAREAGSIDVDEN